MYLKSSEAHVWFADLSNSETCLPWAALVLSDEEMRIAERFRFAPDAARYCLSHAFVRHVLSSYTGVPPADLAFGRQEYGKPHLVGNAPQFNLSHSRDRAALSVSSRNVGIDIEAILPVPEDQQIATTYFTPAEREAIYRAQPPERLAAFLTCWTRKEAYIKGIGKGLTIPLDEFDTSGDSVGNWWITGLPCDAGYVGAIAVEGGAVDIICSRWPGPEGSGSSALIPSSALD